MICIAICDDEKYICNTIQTMLSNFFCKKNMEITIQQFSSGTELLQYNKTIDILFLDIQMDYINGMETARKLRNRKFKGFIIFITILKEMVFQSFEVQAYDYLLKPDNVSAVIHAEAPGSEVTVIPDSWHIFTSISPGSDIAGVPASVIRAILFPSCNF